MQLKFLMKKMVYHKAISFLYALLSMMFLSLEKDKLANTVHLLKYSIKLNIIKENDS